jgi:hypothetical protein
MRLAAERRLLDSNLRPNTEERLTRREFEALLASGRYRLSTGFPATARHWRRSLPGGACLHLVVEGRRRRLHRDSYDPHASLMSLCMHATHEAQTEAAAMIALSWAAISLLAD